MIQQKTFLIEDKEIIIQQFVGTDASIIFFRILRILKGGALGLGGFFENVDVGKIIDGVVTGIEPQQFTLFIKEILQKSMVQPSYTEQWFNDYFSGGLDKLIIILSEILELNYGEQLKNIQKKIKEFLASWKEEKQQN